LTALLAAVCAAFSAVLAVAALAQLGSLARRRVVPPIDAIGAALEHVLRPLRLAGEEGLAPSDRERLRLQLAAGVAGGVSGLYIWGAAGAIFLAPAGAWLAARALIWRRERFRRSVDAGAATAALALADALGAGHSVRGGLANAAADLRGPIGVEMRRAVGELELGAATESALARLRERCRSRRIDLICAAVSIQRRSGGALAGLLRGIAATISEQDRLLDEASAASAQARFTSWVVLALPVMGILLGEVVAPGLITGMAGSPAGRWLLVCALALQVGGALIVLRLARTDR
jgi:tight adherence protein B